MDFRFDFDFLASISIFRFSITLDDVMFIRSFVRMSICLGYVCFVRQVKIPKKAFQLKGKETMLLQFLNSVITDRRNVNHIQKHTMLLWVLFATQLLNNLSLFHHGNLPLETVLICLQSVCVRPSKRCRRYCVAPCLKTKF